MNRKGLSVPFSFVHTSDLHLETSFSGIHDLSTPFREIIQESTFLAYRNLIETCITQNVDFVLIAGDIYNSVSRSLSAQLRFIDGLEELSKAGIWTYIVFGNHDPFGEWAHMLSWPKKTIVFSEKEPEIRFFEKEGTPVATIIGRSHLKHFEKEDLASKFPEREDEWPFTIGLLHASALSSEQHETIAPCTIDTLRNKGYDYWALGHIHKTTFISTNNPLILYPGNIQGMQRGETGEKGCFVIKVSREGRSSYQFHPTESISWRKKEISIEPFLRIENLFSYIQNIKAKEKEGLDNPAIWSLILRGRGILSHELKKPGTVHEINKALNESEKHDKKFIWTDRIFDRTKVDLDLMALERKNNLSSEIIKVWRSLKENTSSFSEFSEDLKKLYTSSKASGYLTKPDKKESEQILDDALDFLLTRLIIEGQDED